MSDTGSVQHAKHRSSHAFVALFVALATSLAWTAGAVAAPVNDDFASATAVLAPFTETLDVSSATIEAGEPQACAFADHTVWYAVTPTQDGTLSADTAGSTTLAQVTAYRAGPGGLSGLSFLGCANFGFGRATFAVQAGRTYYVQASSLFDFPGSLTVNVTPVLPPPNDDFAHALAIGATPFSDTVDLTAATSESGEPAGCQGANGEPTAWYAFTPATSGSYAATRSDGGAVATYTGSGLSALTSVACSFQTTIFRADAGTTYFLQVASPGGFAGGPVTLTVDAAPRATASFVFFPFDPSIFDNVQFIDTSFDLAGIGSRTWRLGDGITTPAPNPTHRYGADGDYDASLSIVTADGRTADATQVVPVRTHDVAITQMAAPRSGAVGRPKQISVGLSNSRYPETVQVSILRSLPNGEFEEIGQVTQGVPARATRRTTSFDISYTFTAQDAVAGKVTFKAVATTLTARDAHPADNTAIALPTKVIG